MFVIHREEVTITCAIVKDIMDWLNPADCIQKYDELMGGQEVSPNSFPEVIKLHIALVRVLHENFLIETSSIQS